MANILSFQDYSYTYERFHPSDAGVTLQKKAALSHINFQVESGDFVLLAGLTGCGKSTLLRSLKEGLLPAGAASGTISFGEGIVDSPFLCGYLGQDPAAGCVTDKVWHELAFGLENMGLSRDEMDRRIAETVSYFDLEDLYEADTASLSGGMLQMVMLASVMAMHPRILLLDEPTASLDPSAARLFLDTLHRIHLELGLTILLAEHHLEETLPYADKLLILEDGQQLDFGPATDVLARMNPATGIYDALPLPLRALRGKRILGEKDSLSDTHLRAEENTPLALTIPQGRALLEKMDLPQGTEISHEVPGHIADVRKDSPDGEATPPENSKPILQLRNLWFRYMRTSKDVLRDLNASFYPGKVYSILGSNGSGKSTLFKILSGDELLPDEGQILLNGKKSSGAQRTLEIAYLPQNVESLLLADTLKMDLKSLGKTVADLPDALSCYSEDTHPYDLSGGEKELYALWKVLQKNSSILLLDEPQKGLDIKLKQELAHQIRTLAQKGCTILLITHDTTFAAKCSDYCSMLHAGTLTSPEPMRHFFLENYFYTTPALRLTRGITKNCVLDEELLSLLEAPFEQTN